MTHFVGLYELAEKIDPSTLREDIDPRVLNSTKLKIAAQHQEPVGRYHIPKTWRFGHEVDVLGYYEKPHSIVPEIEVVARGGGA